MTDPQSLSSGEVMLEQLTTCCDVINTDSSWHDYEMALDDVVQAAAGLPNPAILDVCLFVQDACTSLVGECAKPSQTHRELLQLWGELVKSHLRNPSSDTGQQLLSHLQAPDWPSPLSGSDRSLLQELLQSTQETADAAPSVTNVTDASITAAVIESHLSHESPLARDMIALLMGEVLQIGESIDENQMGFFVPRYFSRVL